MIDSEAEAETPPLRGVWTGASKVKRRPQIDEDSLITGSFATIQNVLSFNPHETVLMRADVSQDVLHYLYSLENTRPLNASPIPPESHIPVNIRLLCPPAGGVITPVKPVQIV